jgi:hypothetical protein
MLTIDNFETVFFKKQNALFIALERQKKVFSKYLPELHRNDGRSFEQVHRFDFNLIHDLEERLKDRVTDLQSKYYSLHWDKYNFNSY